MQNLPPGHFVLAVKVAMSSNLCFMAPITLLPGFKATEDAMGITSAAPRAAARLGVLGILGVAALALPEFVLITSLVGSFASVSCFIMPAACHLHLCRDALGAPTMALDRVIVVFGTVCTAWAIVQTLVARVG